MHMHMPCRVKRRTLQACSSHAAKGAEPVCSLIECVLGVFPIRHKALPIAHATPPGGILACLGVCPWPGSARESQCRLRSSAHGPQSDAGAATPGTRAAASLRCATQASGGRVRALAKDALLRCHACAVLQRRGLSTPPRRPPASSNRAVVYSSMCCAVASHSAALPSRLISCARGGARDSLARPPSTWHCQGVIGASRALRSRAQRPVASCTRYSFVCIACQISTRRGPNGAAARRCIRLPIPRV